MSVFGIFYMGAFVTPVYRMYPNMVKAGLSRFTPQNKPLSRLQEGVGSSFIDNAFHSPLLYIPSFYLAVGAMQGETTKEITDNLQNSWWATVKACWMVWVPVQILNFSIVPVPQRVLFMNGACLFWNVILDFISHDKHESSEAASISTSPTIEVSGVEKSSQN